MAPSSPRPFVLLCGSEQLNVPGGGVRGYRVSSPGEVLVTGPSVPHPQVLNLHSLLSLPTTWCQKKKKIWGCVNIQETRLEVKRSLAHSLSQHLHSKSTLTPTPKMRKQGKLRLETTPFLGGPMGLISCLPQYPAFLCSSPTSQKPEITTLYPGLVTAKCLPSWLQSEE